MSEALRNKGRARNRLLALAVAVFTLSATASAQRNTGRLSLGAGLLYRNGMDVTLAYEHEMNYHNASATYNGKTVRHAGMSARIRFGVTTAPTASAWPTSLAWYGGATTMATCASAHREAATRRSSSQDCISATSTIMCCGRAGCSSGR